MQTEIGEGMRTPRTGKSGMRSRRVVLGTALGVLALAIAARGSPSSPAAPATSTPPTTGHPTAVTVTMTEFTLALSRPNLSPGTYTFTAVNRGHVPHALEINGPGVTDQRTPGELQPGQSADLTVTLRNGSYEFFCPVDSHKERGMDVHITVGNAAAPAPTTTGGTGGGY